MLIQIVFVLITKEDSTMPKRQRFMNLAAKAGFCQKLVKAEMETAHALDRIEFPLNDSVEGSMK